MREFRSIERCARSNRVRNVRAMGVEDNYTDELRALAVIGARTRLAELDAERERLIEMFPEISGKKLGRPRGPIAKAAEPVVMFDAAAAEHHESKADRKRDYRKRRQHDEATKARAVARIKAGEYLADVARELEVVPTVVRRWCDAAGVEPRTMSIEERTARTIAAKAKAARIEKRGRKPGTPNHSPERAALVEKLGRLVEAGASIRGAAKQLGIPPSSGQWVYRAYAKAQRSAKRNGVNGAEG